MSALTICLMKQMVKADNIEFQKTRTALTELLPLNAIQFISQIKNKSFALKSNDSLSK